MNGDGLLAQSSSHRNEDAVNFGLLLVEQADEFVVLFDRLEGFHEDSLSGRGRTVDDSGNLALELRFDRDDEAVAADSDEVFLGASAFAEALQRLAKTGFDGAVLALHGATDSTEFRRSIVVEAAVGFDLAAQETEEWGQVVV